MKYKIYGILVLRVENNLEPSGDTSNIQKKYCTIRIALVLLAQNPHAIFKIDISWKNPWHPGELSIPIMKCTSSRIIVFSWDPELFARQNISGHDSPTTFPKEIWDPRRQSSAASSASRLWISQFKQRSVDTIRGLCRSGSNTNSSEPSDFSV